MSSEETDRLLRKAERLCDSGNESAAFDALNSALAESPLNVRLIAFRAHLYSRNGNYSQALQDLDSAVRVDSRDPYLFLFRGRCLRRLGKFRSAVTDFSRGLELCNEQEDQWYRETLLFLRAEANLRQGRTDDARQDLREIPDDFEFWIDRLISKNDLVRECLNQ